jgi:hypothetical protein
MRGHAGDFLPTGLAAAAPVLSAGGCCWLAVLIECGADAFYTRQHADNFRGFDRPCSRLRLEKRVGRCDPI